VRRRLFNLAAAISLVLCAALLLVWVRSYRWCTNHRLQHFSGSAENRTLSTYDLLWNQGSLQLGRMTLWNYPHDEPQWQLSSESNPADPRAGWAGGRLGVLVYTNTWTYDSSRNARRRTDLVKLPIWSAVVMSSLIPGLWLSGARRRRIRQWRLTHQRCVNCGYDLRATPQEGGTVFDRCPECGTAAAV
jgi:hypothetical protein